MFNDLMESFMKHTMFAIVILSIGIGLMIDGCSKSSNPVGSASMNPNVNLTVAFSKGAGGTGLFKSSTASSNDSIRIDSAIVVLDRIKFESHIDSVTVDSLGNNEQETEQDLNVTFFGPFVVHVRDTLAINFANQTLPPGIYNGIKFKIHRLQEGEHHEDSDDLNHHGRTNTDSATVGSSIIVWGAVNVGGVWTPFTFKFDTELEFKIKGNFVVPAATSNVNIALNFDMSAWFTDPFTGAVLNPLTSSDQQKIREAIRLSFGEGRGGRDDGHRGRPDDDR